MASTDLTDFFLEDIDLTNFQTSKNFKISKIWPHAIEHLVISSTSGQID
jgi:hypothetical protein